jgi:hypothetical protein
VVFPWSCFATPGVFRGGWVALSPRVRGVSVDEIEKALSGDHQRPYVPLCAAYGQLCPSETEPQHADEPCRESEETDAVYTLDFENPDLAGVVDRLNWVVNDGVVVAVNSSR